MLVGGTQECLPPRFVYLPVMPKEPLAEGLAPLTQGVAKFNPKFTVRGRAHRTMQTVWMNHIRSKQVATEVGLLCPTCQPH